MIIECSTTKWLIVWWLILLVYSGGRHLSLMVRMVGVKIHYAPQKFLLTASMFPINHQWWSPLRHSWKPNPPVSSSLRRSRGDWAHLLSSWGGYPASSLWRREMCWCGRSSDHLEDGWRVVRLYFGMNCSSELKHVHCCFFWWREELSFCLFYQLFWNLSPHWALSGAIFWTHRGSGISLLHSSEYVFSLLETHPAESEARGVSFFVPTASEASP